MRSIKKRTRSFDLVLGVWQPRKDSNLRMPESESGALPLGDGAVAVESWAPAPLVAMGGLEPPTPAL